MATYYFDSINGSDTTGNGSINNPWATYNAKKGSTATGDTCLFKRGTTQVISTIFLAVRSGTSLTAPFVMGAYGNGPNPIFVNPTNPWSYILDGSDQSYVTIQDLDFNCGNLPQSSIYLATSGASNVTGWRIKRCNFYGSSTLYGIVVRKAVSASLASTISDIEFDQCSFYRNGSSGIIVTAATNVRIKRSIAWGNGFAGSTGGHGFSFAYNRTSVTSGWTNTSGNIYSHSLGALEVNVDYVSFSAPVASVYRRLLKNTATPTTPGVGEFGVSGTTLYVNIGSSPNSKSCEYAWGRCGDNLIEDCESYGNVSSPNWTSIEGHGFAFDDYAEDSIMRRCYSHDNVGSGFSNNKGSRNTYDSCISINNGLPAIVVSPADSVVIKHMTTMSDNMSTAGIYDSSIVYADYSTNGRVLNCNIIAKPAGNTYGINIDTNCTGMTVDHNAIFGATTRVRTVTETNAVTGTSPLVNSTGYPISTSPLVNAGGFISYGADFNKVIRKNPPTVGAYEYIASRSVATNRGVR